jgi:cytochrome c556
MRYLVCLLLGLIIGALCAVTAANILARRNAYPKALMTVMNHELKVARDAAATPNCDASGPALAKLALLAPDIIVAMPDGATPDRVFHQYANDLATAIQTARNAPCQGRTQALTDLGNACDACHRDYR